MTQVTQKHGNFSFKTYGYFLQADMLSDTFPQKDITTLNKEAQGDAPIK